MALTLSAVAACGDPPATINIRGQLLDTQGHGLSGLRNYRVQFYDAATGGNVLGGPMLGQADVSLEGLFNIEVQPPSPVVTSAQAWYELAISSAATPGTLTSSDTFPNRVKVESVPFALESSNATHVDVPAIGSGAVALAEFNCLAGLTGGIQGQLDAKANNADVYTKGEVDSSQSAQDSAISGKIAKAGDTMSGALQMSGAPISVTNSYVNVGQSTAPSPVTDNLYNLGGTLQWNGNPAYRFPWTTVTANSQMAGNNGYIANADSMVLLTLPASASLNVGDTIRVSGLGAGGWKIAQNASQYVLTGALQILGWTAGATLQNWSAVASSADGTKLVACVFGGQIYTSTDSGATWTARATLQNWSAVASSADGTKLVACVAGMGQIYTSTDSGATWTVRGGSPQYWQCVASSADGTKLVAGVAPGQIYTSTDSGATWTPRATSQTWWSVASSADGTRLVAVVNGGQIYTSTDSGATWTARASSQYWYGVASSGDGTKLVAFVQGGQIYTSTDSGVTWTPRATSQPWQGVASSADGTKLVACVFSGNIYTSTDSGLTWTAGGTSYNWTGVASSADGTKLAACGGWGNGGLIYTYGIKTSTTVGTTGSLSGWQNMAVELQYMGSDTFVPISYVGSLGAN